MDQAYLFNIGENFESYNFLGAHRTRENDQDGYVFRVWAPNAQAVTVFGSFNGWNKFEYFMHKDWATGIFSLFIPNLADWTRYKYCVQQQSGNWVDKIDPFGRHFEERPSTATILIGEGDYVWQDEEFCRQRKSVFDPQPLNIYEMHLGSWMKHWDGNCYSYRDLAERLPDYLNDMGYNAVEFMPVTEYPLDASWGYQVTGYFAATSRYGTPNDLKYLVDCLHRHGIKVIFDWVPAHFPKNEVGLARFDGTPQFEYADPLKGEQPSWGTYIFDFAKREVHSFLISSANFWIKEFHGDGIRVDAVSAMLYLDFDKPNGSVRNIYGGNENLEAIDFLRRVNSILRDRYPYCMLIAEESTAYPSITKSAQDGGLGFTHKWNMGWMHDTLDYYSLDYLYRVYHYHMLTFSLTYAFSENFVLPFSHDEVVHGKKSILGRQFGDLWRQMASARSLYAWQIGHPGAKLNFMGYELGQFAEWNFNEQIDWYLLEYEHHAKLHNYIRKLNHLYLSEPALWTKEHDWSGFKWLQVNDAKNSVYAYARFADKPEDTLVFIFNNTPAVLDDYKLELPYYGKYEVLLNSDDNEWYGSDNLGKLQEIQTVTLDAAAAKQNYDLTKEKFDKKLQKFSKEHAEMKKKLAALKEEYVDLLLEQANYGKLMTMTRDDVQNLHYPELKYYSLPDLAMTELQTLTSPYASCDIKLPPLSVLILKYKGN